jgi:hypothetical protein
MSEPVENHQGTVFGKIFLFDHLVLTTADKSATIAPQTSSRRRLRGSAISSLTRTCCPNALSACSDIPVSGAPVAVPRLALRGGSGLLHY